MYNYTEIKSIHFEITSKCQAKCPMCPRRPFGGVLNPYITLDEISIEQFKDWFPKDFIKQLDRFFMCGNLGDPIIAKDTLKIFQYLKSINSNISLSMITNGSARTASWWKEIASLKVQVVFGIDGLNDTHHLYRIGTDFDRILKNAKSFIEAGGEAIWDMLVFKHNEHQVEKCRSLSQSLGFKDFRVKHTSRFKDKKLEVVNEQGSLVNIIYPTDKSIGMIDKVENAVQETLPNINCKAKISKEIYVSANGSISPCCWLDVDWFPPTSASKIDYIEKIGRFPNLKNQSLEEIFDCGFFSNIQKCWGSTGLKECSKQCGSFDKQREQYE